ncbi:hypothetical protein HDU93_002037 [Gonapodya sp. JEL0774]|nr:hypothetical protein HDU93_002037 [Gonapodya sp. JEL0774]
MSLKNNPYLHIKPDFARTRAGILPAIAGFLVWCLPGFLTLTVLGAVVGSSGNGLPSWIVAIENGIISAALGLLALAAYRLSRTILTAPLSRTLALAAFSIGINLSAPYVFPVIMVASATVTVAWERGKVWAAGSARGRRIMERLKRGSGGDEGVGTSPDIETITNGGVARASAEQRSILAPTRGAARPRSHIDVACVEESLSEQSTHGLAQQSKDINVHSFLHHNDNGYGTELQIVPDVDHLLSPVENPNSHLPRISVPSTRQRRASGRDCELDREQADPRPSSSWDDKPHVPGTGLPSPPLDQLQPTDQPFIPLTARQGTMLALLWVTLLACSAPFAILHPSLPAPLLLLSIFWFTGSVAFGGLAVVVPLLQTWLTGKSVTGEPFMKESDFVVGVAVTNAVPGPVFNFAGYFGALAMKGAPTMFVSAILSWIGMFAPGLILITGMLPLWSSLRSHPLSRPIFAGLNAAAVGLLFSAFYGLWQKGVSPLSHDVPTTTSPQCVSTSVGDHQIHVALAAVAFVSVGYLGVPSPVAVVVGGIVGAVEYGVGR